MSLWIDVKFSKMAGSSIERFSVQKDTPFLAIGRCKICGDSSRNKTKCRFYFYEKDGKVNTVCHNCGWSSSLFTYLRDQEPSLYRQYTLESFGKKNRHSEPVVTTDYKELFKLKLEPSPKVNHIETLPLVSELPDDHRAKRYLIDRKIPLNFDFRYAEKFCTFASKYKSEFSDKKEHARIVIPFRNREGKYCGFQARTLGNEKPKYYSVFSSNSQGAIFGIDKIKKDKLIYTVEGPIDSLYLPNCIAARSSSLSQAAVKSSEILNNNPKDDYVLVFDNEPRNKEIVEKYSKAIDEGYSVVIWNSTFNYKDLNEAVTAGMKPIELYRIIQSNTYRGLEAKLKFNYWKRI